MAGALVSLAEYVPPAQPGQSSRLVRDAFQQDAGAIRFRNRMFSADYARVGARQCGIDHDRSSWKIRLGREGTLSHFNRISQYDLCPNASSWLAWLRKKLIVWCRRHGRRCAPHPTPSYAKPPTPAYSRPFNPLDLISPAYSAQSDWIFAWAPAIPNVCSDKKRSTTWSETRNVRIKQDRPFLR